MISSLYMYNAKWSLFIDSGVKWKQAESWIQIITPQAISIPLQSCDLSMSMESEHSDTNLLNN